MQKYSRTFLTVLSVSCALALTGCSALPGLGGGQGHLVFENKSEAVSQGSTDVPAWVPDDAATIVVDFPANGPGYMMKFASKTGVPISAACVADPDTPTQPPTSASWWPKQTPTADRRKCGDTHVARAGGEWYAWSNGS